MYSVEAADKGVEVTSEVVFLVIQPQRFEPLVAVCVDPVEYLVEATGAALGETYRVCLGKEELFSRW